MTTVRSDRAIFLFGGQYGERLFDDLWQYNVNTNMWNKVILEDSKLLLNRGGPADIAGAIALKPYDLYLSQYLNCTACAKCKTCGTLSFERSNCFECTFCTQNNATGLINCQNCQRCVMNFLHPDAATTTDCLECDTCLSCIDAADWKGPMRMKGATMTLSSEGLLVYGGAYWQETNITFSDEVRRKIIQTF